MNFGGHKHSTHSTASLGQGQGLFVCIRDKSIPTVLYHYICGSFLHGGNSISFIIGFLKNCLFQVLNPSRFS